MDVTVTITTKAYVPGNTQAEAEATFNNAQHPECCNYIVFFMPDMTVSNKQINNVVLQTGYTD